MKRKSLYTIGVAIVLLMAGAAVSLNYAINQAIAARYGPVYRFPIPSGEKFLTDKTAESISRQVMKQDGFSASDWTLVTDERTWAPDGEADHYLVRNTDPNQGFVGFYCASAPVGRPNQRLINLQLSNGQITAQGYLGK
ncbi:MAG TPA: hypothetical protein VL992_20205 [Tepidisphaeraceae bacterium]|nr:hypothetical protein [Tepidisphaeraceae bacterium]